MSKRVALYARVSTDGQSVDNQLRELEAVASKEGWEIVGRFVDHGISGAKGRAVALPSTDCARASCGGSSTW